MAAVESGRVRQASVVCAVLWVALAGVVLQAKADVPFTADSITYFPVDTFDIFSTEANITITHLDWDSKKTPGSLERRTPFTSTFAVVGAELNTEIDGNGVVSFAYFGNDSSRSLIATNSYGLPNGTSFYSFALGPCSVDALRKKSKQIWERITVSFGFESIDDHEIPFTNVTGGTLRYYEDAELRLNREQFINFPVPHPMRLFVLRVDQDDFAPMKPSAPVRSFTLRFNLTRRDDQAPNISTVFSKVIMTSNSQCPESSFDDTKAGVYETWDIEQSDEDVFVHDFKSDIFFNFHSSNSTDVYFGLFVSSLATSNETILTSSYTIAIEFRTFATAYPVEDFPLWAIITSVILGLLVVALIIAVILWSRSQDHSYEILY